jgi:hypothetical protein
MSYAKKDEDADMPGFKLDRTSVFQDGQEMCPLSGISRLTRRSSSIQLFSNIAPKMSSTTYKDCCSTLYWREVSYERSNNPLLWDLEAVSEQGSFVKTNGLPDYQGVGTYGRGCYNVDEHNHEGYVSWK